MFDIKIVGGEVIDGTGAPRVKADVGIKGDVIAAISDLSDADSKITIGAEGKAVCPGFIDMHTHSDFTLLYDGHANSSLHDGVTTEAIGNCGIGVAPVNPENRELLLDYLASQITGSVPIKLETHWTTYEEYLDYVRAADISINIAPIVAHGPIRIAEMGFSDAKADSGQVARMRAMSSEAMAAGGVGISSGLVYMPGIFTDTEELTEVVRGIRDHNGFYVTHMRNEGDEIFEALEEAIAIATGAGVPLHISHLKLASKKVYGQTERLLRRIDEAAEAGLDIDFDVYPYTAGMTSMTSCLPPWVFEGGLERLLDRLHSAGERERIIRDCENGVDGWESFVSDGGFDRVLVASVALGKNKSLEGLSLAEIAEERNIEPYEALFQILIEDEGHMQAIFLNIMQEEDMKAILQHPKAIVAADGMSLSTEGLLAYGRPHPRIFGTRGTVLGKFVREEKLLPLETAIKKMTSMPAHRLGLSGRGALREGYYADIVVFDEGKVASQATYKDPKRYTTGIEKVIVNGELVLSDGIHQETFPGRVVGRQPAALAGEAATK
jgi:N-acyl-D-amino-acid deacylase